MYFPLTPDEVLVILYHNFLEFRLIHCDRQTSAMSNNLFIYLISLCFSQIMKEMNQCLHAFMPRGQMQFFIRTMNIIVE